jgi:4-hydroxybenzoate polyprenyltransferase
VSGKWRAYFELLRFPAVFTAVADVMMGYLVRNGDLEPTFTFALLVLASSSLYLAGMVFNDAFDADVDARERPERPIPSGLVARSTAFRIGWALFIIGVGAAWTVELQIGDRGPLLLAVALAIFVYLYDWEVKWYSIGPLNMGYCRTLNVLLGMSTVGIVDGRMTSPWTTTQFLLAAAMGVYIAGVTVFARGEATNSDRRRLATGCAVLLAGIALFALAPVRATPSLLQLNLPKWFLLWALIALVIARRCIVAWRDPTPHRVQQAVRLCIRSIIVIDAAIVLGFCGPFWGCAVLSLLAPMLLLERWASTT